MVEEGKDLTDPSPLWDDDGKAFLSHAYAGSRASIKSILVVKPMMLKEQKQRGQEKLFLMATKTILQ